MAPDLSGGQPKSTQTGKYTSSHCLYENCCAAKGELGTREGLSGEITLVLRPNTEQVVRSLGAGIPGAERASAKALREDQACHGHKEADVAGE